MSNLSQKRRQEMLDYINQLKEIHNDDESIIALNKIENALTEKKYGLVWEEHSEYVDEMLKENVPVLTEVEDRKIISNEADGYNFLLEGDNLHSLKLLEKTHKGRIDVIYIDPPYNTLKDGFTYSDTLVDSNDGFRHSKWISFMYERLVIARDLMRDDGIIFISIDENEYAQLKLICDEIFGEGNFVENIIWNKRVPKNDKGIGNIHEYILTYVKDSSYKYKLMTPKEGIEEIKKLKKKSEINSIGPKEFESELRKLYKKNKYPRAITLYNNVDNKGKIFGKINMSWPNGNTEGPRYDVLHPITKNPVKVPDRGWRWSEETFNGSVDYKNPQILHDGSIICGKIWFSKNDNMQPSSINYLKDLNRMLLRSIISLKSDGGMTLEKIFGEKNLFAYPKPVLLIQELIDSKTYNKKNSIVLDFFAGSGTTGQAVVQLNEDDGGNRKYILCTNNENNICEEITYQRLQKIQYEFPHNLKYFKTDFIKRFGDEEEILSDRLLSHIKEMVELENMCEIDGKDRVLILTEDELQNWYAKGIVAKTKVYLPSYILLSREIELEAERKGVEFIDVPEYYFEKELREANEI